jgi:polyferredoxin
VTALLIVGYFVAASVIDSVFRGSGFCKYVCPIGQFHFVSSLVSPGEISIREPETCKSCRTYDCIRGNENAGGCELNLFLPVKSGNMDCTFCMDCVQACPQENVTIAFAVRTPDVRWSKRKDVAVLSATIVCGAFVSAGAMVSPVMMWEHGIPGGMQTGMALLILVGVVVPALWAGRSGVRRFVPALVPLGLAMWTAHLGIHLSATLGLGLSHGFQLFVLDAGLILSWYFAWRMRRMGPWAPGAAVALGLYVAGVWICFQPMASMGRM